MSRIGGGASVGPDISARPRILWSLRLAAPQWTWAGDAAIIYASVTR